MSNPVILRTLSRCLLLAVSLMLVSPAARSQAWGAVGFFKYNIENVTVVPGAPGTWTVKAIFSVTRGDTDETWDIQNALPFKSQGASLTLDIGWDPAEFTNTGSANPLLSPIVTTGLGTGAAVPLQIRNLQTTGATRCGSDAECPGVSSLANRFWVARTVTPVGFMSPVKAGRVALEGKPVCNGIPGYACPAAAPPPAPPYLNVPVPSAVASFAFTATESLAAIIPDPRRPIVDISKCHQCHDGNRHGDTVVPRLSLHGNNRTENLGLCVVCHNANQTDVPYRYLTSGTTADPRISGPEVPIDFKVMVHSIHAGGFRESPYVVVGFNSSVNDFSDVRFPRALRDCTSCHIDAGGKGTFELPLGSTVLGTTVKTNSVYQVPLSTPVAPSYRSINVNPFDDVKISPIAAVCSSCHDKREVKSHMIRTGGASFATTQAAIGKTVTERCANCHGPGREKDVRKAHEIRGDSGDGDHRHDD